MQYKISVALNCITQNTFPLDDKVRVNLCKIKMVNGVNFLLSIYLIQLCFVCSYMSHFVKFIEVQGLKSGLELMIRNDTDSNPTNISTMPKLQCLQLCLIFSECDAVKYVVATNECELFKNAVVESATPNGRSAQANVYLKVVRARF